MTHFVINSINDVLPHIEGRSDFIVADKGAYKVVDYVYVLPDSFAHPARIECRGLKFDCSGRLIARPLHKFRNVGETPELQPDRLDFTQPHVVMDKLDGSMIHPAIVDGRVRFMTRMGCTDVAAKAERHLSGDVEEHCRTALQQGCTPIFEWTAPDNRIVVSYPESSLTLLAARWNYTGEYLDHVWLSEFAASMHVPFVTLHPSTHATAAEFLSFARAIKGAEGFVVRFENGIWVKAKADDYVLKHRAKDSIFQEKNVLALVLSGGLDDVLPLLDDPDAKAAREYAAEVEAGLAAQGARLAAFVAANDRLTPKDFATQAVPTLPSYLRTAAFLARRGSDPVAVLRAHVAANTNSQSKVDECRAIHGATWRLA